MYRLWLASLITIPSGKRNEWVTCAGSAKNLYGMSKGMLKELPGIREEEIGKILASKANFSLDREWMKLQEGPVSATFFEDASYPERLRHIANAPNVLYHLGELPDPKKKAVAIVGSRRRTAYGEQVARKLSYELAKQGFAVIGGMALGIDTDGHMGALEAGGKTYAVLGCGVDVCYPKSNSYLYEKIKKQGGVLSEYPPGTNPIRINFPMRNRIIAGLSDYTVVIEARKKSGSLITADFAMEQGRDVYALPGRITEELSQGCNELIRQGAGILTSVEDFLEEISLIAPEPYIQQDFRRQLLDEEETQVYDQLDYSPLGLGSLVQSTPYDMEQVLRIVDRLVEKGMVKEGPSNYYVKQIW